MLDSKNQKAQIGETMTWIVATIIIVVILILSLYTTSLLAQTKKIASYKYERESDLLMEKSLFSYFLAEDEITKAFIYDWLREQDFNADLEDKLEELGGNIG